MSDLMRMTGMYSGMDTEAVIQSLVSAKAKKVTDLKNDQKKLEWKQNIWQDLNSKIYNLYSKTLSNLRLAGGYNKKSTTVSDPTKATVVANGNAVDGTQTLEVKQLAKAKYITGGRLKSAYGENLKVKSDNTLGSLDPSLIGSTINVTSGTGDDAKTTAIEVTSDMKISDFVAKLNEAGLNASYDEDNQRLFINSKKTGKENSFNLSVSGYAGGSEAALGKLGLTEAAGASIVDAQDSEIILNGASFTDATNSITVNGLTVEATALTEGEITISTKTDYQGIYDTIKDFISEYNDIVNEVYSRYNPDTSKKYWKYDMLTDEEKEAMSDEEIEAWEDNIKEGLLRKDTSLSKVLNGLTSSITKGFETSSGTKYLFDFGIGTLNYFEAADGERKSLHINGDADDENTADKEDKLMKALTTDTEGTIEFFAAFCKDMYSNLHDTMTQVTDYSSIYKVYDDKRLKSEYDDYTKKIKEAEDKLSAYEDKWYKKFSDMEVALSKLQSQQNTISSMLGM